MKEKINAFDYAETIAKAFRPGIFLNTNGDKFNSMVIGWGGLGILWGKPVFTVYVRQSRYTKPQLDKTGEFTISVPLEKADPDLVRICGRQSGYDINKADYLTLEDPETNNTPGIREFPLTLECRVIYSCDQVMEKIPEEALDRFYGQGSDVGDYHTEYIGEIVDAYIIRED
ncbi:MAG: flavin reductase family protein [Erysipelotrichaceae bacterium]|nr:flavin reductase family protein [Erysipelotrichaceae bacterium]